MIRGQRSMFGALLSAIVLVPATATTAAPVVSTLATAPQAASALKAHALRASLTQATAGTARFAERAGTGALSFAGGSTDQPLQPPSGKGSSAAARQFVDDFGPAFGVQTPTTDLTESGSFHASSGDAVRFQQSYRGVPVIGGELAVQLAPSGAVVSTAGKAAVGLAVGVTPAVSKPSAIAAARAVTAKHDNVDPAALVVDAPVLSIFDPTLWNITDPAGQRLVWRTSAHTSTGEANRYVLVDATTGAIALDFTQVEAVGLDRQVCDNGNAVVASPVACAAPVRVETQAATGNADVDGAYDLAGVTYNFYKNVLARDSIDGLGHALKSTVRLCLSGRPCPYANAFWDGVTEQMFYGQGYATADDVVGHELTHGVTQFTSGLLYYGQSGAINESMSDVFGELIDRSTPDAGVPWALGEDLPGFSPNGLRNMQDPTLFNDPDRMTSVLYSHLPSSDPSFDNAGVHTNSGINNKAAYLIDAGATFNGQTITGIGDTKTAWIYYVAQAAMLSTLSQYSDLAVILPQACTNLIGHFGIGANDCAQVSKAVLATEMKSQPASAADLAPPSDCITVGAVKNHLVVADRQNLDASWTLATTTPLSQAPFISFGVTAGDESIVFPDPVVPTTLTATRNAAITIPAGETFLSFRHMVSLEPTFDGGVVEYSINGGATWLDVSSLAGQGTGNNGYDGTALAVSGPAFTSDRPVFRTTRFNLSALAGQSVRLRFREVTDLGGQGDGWYISSPTVYTCGVALAPDPPINVIASAGDQQAAVSWPLNTFDGGSAITGYRITPFRNGVAQTPVVVGAVTSAFVSGLVNGDSYAFTVAAVNAKGTSADSDVSNAVVPDAPYVSLNPARLMETRSGYTTVDGQYNGIGIRPAGSVTALQVAGRGGVPVGASAAVLNVTVTEAQGPGFITVYPCDVARPTASNLNYVAGSTVPNLVVAKLDPSGSVCVYAHGTTQVIVDVNGYFSTGSMWNSLVPARLFESRSGYSTVDGAYNNYGPIGGLSSIYAIGVSGRGGVGSAQAALLNVTVTNPRAAGFVTIFPCAPPLPGSPYVPPVVPTASNLNYVAGQTVANSVFVGLDLGFVCVRSTAAVDLVVDVNAWMTNPPDVVSVIPARLMESRPGLTTIDGQFNGIGLRGAGQITELQVTGRGGVPDDATAVALNVTVTDSRAPGFVTVFPCGSAVPTASSLNYGVNTTVPNAVIAKIGIGGKVCFLTHASTHILADVNGYFTG